MARARLLKPDFFEDETITSLPFGARLLFEALWCLADREGRLEDRPARIAAFAFPPMGNERQQAQARRECPQWLDLLLNAGSVQRYEVQGESYLLLTHFKDHQRIHQNEPQSSLPPPLDTNGNQSTPMVSPNISSHAIGVGSRSRSRSRKEAEAEAELPTRPLIFSLYENAIGGISGLMVQKLKEAEGEYPAECIEHSFEAAVVHNKRSWAYVEAILKKHAATGDCYAGAPEPRSGRADAAVIRPADELARLYKYPGAEFVLD